MAAKRGEEMVDQIMAFAETRAAIQGVANLVRAVETSRELVAPSMYPGALLEIEVPATALWVCGNEVQIGQMITNLITNGRDALDGGSGVVEVEADIAPPEGIERFRGFSGTPCERLVG